MTFSHTIWGQTQQSCYEPPFGGRPRYFLHFACRMAQESRPKLRKSPAAALQLFTKNAFCKEFLTPEKQANSAKFRMFGPSGGS